MSNELPSMPAGPNGSVPTPWKDASLEPAYAPGPEPSRGGGLPLRRILAAIVRYRWLVLAAATVGAAGGFVATKFVKPVYEAQATLWLGGDGPNSAQRGPVQSPELLQPEGYLQLIRSFAVLDYVVRDQRLYLVPRNDGDLAFLADLRVRQPFRPGAYRMTVDRTGRSYALSTAEGIMIEQGALGGQVGEALGFDWAPAPGSLGTERTLEFELRVPRDVALEVGRKVRTELGRDGRFIRVAYSDTDPERVASVVNSLNDRVVSIAGELKRLKLDELTEVLSEQLRQAEQRLQQAEIGLESYRVQTITLPTERAAPIAAGLEITTNPVIGNYFTLKVQGEQLRQDRELIVRTVRERSDTVPIIDALAMIPSVQGSQEFTKALDEVVARRAHLRQMRQRYTDDHPDVRKAVDDLRTLEERTVPNVAMRIADNLAVREAEIESKVGSVSGELQQIPPRMIEEARFKRTVAIAEQLYTMLRQRFEDARLAALSSIPDLRVLDEATVPAKPVRDNRLIFMLFGVLGGIGVGLAGAVLLDRADPRFQHPEQVTQQTGLGILGAVPHVRTSDGYPEPQAAAAVAEAFREIRLSLSFARAHEGPFEVTLTSPGSGEGKSFISLNLALAFAEMGKSTLLIDGDIRRGTLHRMFDGTRSPGLTDYLSGQVPREAVVRRTEFANLHMVPSGTRMQIGPELLGSERMREALQHLRTQYEVIIIDSAPMGAGSDAYVLGTLTGNLALILRSGRTSREFTEAKLALLDRLPIRLLGVILNDVPSSRLYSYYPYLSGYEAHDEEVEESAQVAVVS
jgi:capsular exopolysaccharide synthesis family protein